MQKHTPVRPTRGAAPVALDMRELLWLYRMQLGLVVAAAFAVGAFQLLRLLFF
ncbi:MAG: hypothetical protein ABI456_04900 [Ktedonobacteraceae bacterium]|nr:hypothetical protein [Chloroflexota bacterium]